MTKASDNEFPSVLFGELGAAPTTPAAGKWRVYTKSTGLFIVDDAGAETGPFGAGGSGIPATIFDAAGDIIVASAADTAARLAAGAAGGVLAMGNSAVIWNAGTSFPASKATNDRYWRTDLGMEFFWDGTRWLSSTLYDTAINNFPSTTISSTSTSNRLAIPDAGVLSVWAISFWMSFFVAGGTALGASHKWVCTLVKSPAGTTIATVNIDSGASSAWRTSGAVAINAAIETTQFELEVVSTKTGTPGDLYPMARLKYRMIAT